MAENNFKITKLNKTVIWIFIGVLVCYLIAIDPDFDITRNSDNTGTILLLSIPNPILELLLKTYVFSAIYILLLFISYKQIKNQKRNYNALIFCFVIVALITLIINKLINFPDHRQNIFPDEECYENTKRQEIDSLKHQLRKLKSSNYDGQDKTILESQEYINEVEAILALEENTYQRQYLIDFGVKDTLNAFKEYYRTMTTYRKYYLISRAILNCKKNNNELKICACINERNPILKYTDFNDIVRTRLIDWIVELFTGLISLIIVAIFTIRCKNTFLAKDRYP
jgi:hypothetical protein